MVGFSDLHQEVFDINIGITPCDKFCEFSGTYLNHGGNAAHRWIWAKGCNLSNSTFNINFKQS